MLKSPFYKKLYLGNNTEFDSISEEKRAILTGQLSLICILLSIFYFVVDAILGSTSSVPEYILLATIGVGSLLINRAGRTKIAKNFLMVGANVVVFITFEREFQGTGSFMFFISCMLGSFALFGFEGKKYAIALSLFSLLLFFIAYFVEFDFLPKTDFTAEEAQLNFVINFTVASTTAIVIIIFLLNLNTLAESDLIETTEELKSNKKRFELAIKGSSAGIWDWDIVNDRIFISPQLMTLLDYPDVKYANIDFDQIRRVIHPDDLKQFDLKLAEHLNEQKPFHAEMRFKRNDGSYVWVLDTGQAEWNEKGRAVRMVGTIVEVDDLKKAFKQLEEQNTLLEKTNEELDRFVYSTSHDLKAPLSSIQGLVNVAIKSKDEVEMTECLRMIENRVQTLNGFIAEIIDYSRNSRLDIALEKVNLRDLISELIEGLQFFDRSEQIHFDIQIDDDFTIKTDKGRLKIILNNLLANAIKYHDWSKDSQVIKVIAEDHNHSITVKVEDNGLGIDDELQDKIFNMFFRASEKSEGSGLGLYIAKEMVAKLNGTIGLKSEVGKGSCFFVNLPVHKV
ncbi:sensor histidine kinase [Fulvivirga lutea]|uniref:histidine kinase n=1 Tax=Fulvivirga lutea TaxID=2810512 RepID=A0A974WHR9_9BACT|nr:PAS domain-containing sensor histidine kinase [Fulvivirga lutea]QSE98370.1 PAS domain-containing sensor histidine kinase [Fulvivirga lutea]